MAKFLFTWELGSGLGHLANMRPIVAELVARGHEVSLALCQLASAASFFPGLECHPAPLSLPTGHQRVAEPSTFAEVLYNCGCDDVMRLAPLVAEWQKLFAEVRPDVLVAEFSPIAFLAAQGSRMKIVQMATGHAWPPNISPLPDLCPWRNNYPERLALTENRVLATLNNQLESMRQPPISHVAELFTRRNLQLLTTFPEMDHYQHRADGNYAGNWSHLAGDVPDWPQGKSPRVFAYLKNLTSAATVLGELDRRGISTLAFLPDEKLSFPMRGHSVRIIRHALDMTRVAGQCDLAILHTGHGTTVQMLLAGKPILAIPILGEQGIVAQNVARLGAGITVDPDNPPEILAGLSKLLSDDSYVQAARVFRDKYASFESEHAVTQVADQFEGLLGPNSGEFGYDLR